MAYTTINKSTDYFNTKLYTGNGSTQSITGVGFQPDFTWLKCRNDAQEHRLTDVVRGTTKGLESNSTLAEFTTTNTLTSFDSDGFSLGNSAVSNYSGNTHVSWNWKANGTGSANTDGTISSTVSANTTAGFSIVKYTGTGANATVGHGLGAVPKMMIFKELGGTNGWHVYHEFLGNNKVSLLDNVTQGYYNPNSFLNTTDPTSSLIYLGDNAGSNSTNGTIAYCFAEKTGYSKINSFTGNGNADGTFVYTGFKPSFVLWRNTSSGGYYWHIMDNKREPNNPAGLNLFPNLSNAENDYGDTCDFVSNGFKFRTGSSGLNTNGQVYMFMAFAEAPLVGTNNVPCTAR